VNKSGCADLLRVHHTASTLLIANKKLPMLSSFLLEQALELKLKLKFGHQ
jgi:hypothetical protein